MGTSRPSAAAATPLAKPLPAPLLPFVLSVVNPCCSAPSMTFSASSTSARWSSASTRSSIVPGKMSLRVISPTTCRATKTGDRDLRSRLEDTLSQSSGWRWWRGVVVAAAAVARARDARRSGRAGGWWWVEDGKRVGERWSTHSLAAVDDGEMADADFIEESVDAAQRHQLGDDIW